MKKWSLIVILIALSVNVITVYAIEGVDQAMKLTSTSFVNQGDIPKKCTCDGEDVSPALAWHGVPDIFFPRQNSSDAVGENNSRCLRYNLGPRKSPILSSYRLHLHHH